MGCFTLHPFLLSFIMNKQTRYFGHLKLFIVLTSSLRCSTSVLSPRLNLFFWDVLPMRLLGSRREQRQVHRSDGALLWRLGGFWTGHVGADPTGTTGVQQDLWKRSTKTFSRRNQTPKSQNKTTVVSCFQTSASLNTSCLWSGIIIYLA